MSRSKGIVIVSTKVLPNKLANQFITNQFKLIQSDFITITLQPIQEEFLRNSIICTSQNAVRGLIEQIKMDTLIQKNFFCVGTRSKSLVEQIGGKVIKVYDYAEDLANEIVHNHVDEQFTFVSGNLRRDELPRILDANGIDCIEYPIYETKLSPEHIKEGRDALLFYSPSGVESFLQKNTIQNEICFCIGRTTAGALQGITENIKTASKPSIATMVEECINYYA